MMAPVAVTMLSLPNSKTNNLSLNPLQSMIPVLQISGRRCSTCQAGNFTPQPLRPSISSSFLLLPKPYHPSNPSQTLSLPPPLNPRDNHRQHFPRLHHLTLGAFDQRDWVVTSYLLTYTGFLVIYAKFSDILGRKPMLLFALGVFTLFSIACGSSRTMLQLIIFRALQGTGASGIYSLVTVMQPEMVPPERWGKYVGVTSMVLIAVVLPRSFPYKMDSGIAGSRRLTDGFTLRSLARLDVIGALLLLSASVLLVFGFEEAGTRFPWDSVAVLSTLVIGVVLLVAFVIWEEVIAGDKHVQEPVFPMRLMKDRRFVGMLLVSFGHCPWSVKRVILKLIGVSFSEWHS